MIDHLDWEEDYNAAMASKQNWYAQYNQIYLYVIPNRTAFNVAYNYDNSAKFENLQIYDCTAVIAAYKRAIRMHSLLFPHERKWGRYVVNDAMAPGQITWAQKSALDTFNDYIYEHINSSNLPQEAALGMLDLVGGMCVLKIESPSEEEPLRFKCIPSFLTYIGIYQDSHISTLWIKEQFPGREVIKRFKYNGPYAKEMRDTPTAIVSVITGQIEYKPGKFYYYTFLEKDYREVIYEEELDYQAIIVGRDHVHPGETDGRGIAMDLIWQIRDLNLLCRDDRMSLTLKANPPVFYDSSLPVNPYSFRNGLAGSMLPRTPGMSVPLEAFVMPDNPNVDTRILALQQQIEDAFRVNPLGPPTQPVRSATEISIRQDEAQQTLSTDMSRLIKDLPERIFDTAAHILIKMGKVPAGLMELRRNKKIKFDFASPLFDLQEEADLHQLGQGMQFIQQFFGEQAAIGVVNIEMMREYLIEKLRLPHNIFKTPEEIQGILQQIGKMAMGGQLPTPTTGAQQLPALTGAGTGVSTS
jgi:hypothetical protein